MTEEELLRTEEVRIRIMALGPGQATPWHHHTRVTDRMVALRDPVTVETQLPDQTLHLQPGDHCAIEPHTIHRVLNLADHEVRYLLVQGVGRYDFVPAVEP